MGLTRALPTATKTALAGTFYPVVMVELDWPGGAARFHTGVGTIVYDSQNWSGVGDLSALGVPEESAGLPPARASVQLIGSMSDILATLATEVRGRSARVLLGITTEPGGNTLVADPALLFVGTLDTLAHDYTPLANGDMASFLETEIKTGPAARSSARITHSREDQAEAFSGDTAGRHLEQLRTQVKLLRWPNR